MTNVDAHEAEGHLAELLDRVERGEEITVTRDGAAVARLVPVKPVRDEAAIRAALRRMDEAARKATLGGIKIKDLINEGRKY
jgi:prevent-host-death family protein